MGCLVIIVFGQLGSHRLQRHYRLSGARSFWFSEVYDVSRTGGENAVAFSSDVVGYCPQTAVETRIKNYCNVLTDTYKKDYSRAGNVNLKKCRRCSHHKAVNVVDELRASGTVDGGTKLAVIVNDAFP